MLKRRHVTFSKMVWDLMGTPWRATYVCQVSSARMATAVAGATLARMVPNAFT